LQLSCVTRQLLNFKVAINTDMAVSSIKKFMKNNSVSFTDIQ